MIQGHQMGAFLETTSTKEPNFECRGHATGWWERAPGGLLAAEAEPFDRDGEL